MERSSDEDDIDGVTEQVVAAVQPLVDAVGQLDQSDFGTMNRQSMFQMARQIVQHFPEINLMLTEVIQVSCSAVEGIVRSLCTDSVTVTPKTRCDALVALVKQSVAHEVKHRVASHVHSPVSEDVSRLSLCLRQHVLSESLDGSHALVIVRKVQAVERGITEALNKLGEMDALVKEVSDDIGIEKDLWDVTRKSICAGKPADTLDVTMGHLQSDLRTLRDILRGASRGTAFAGGMGRKSAWTDPELQDMQMRSRNVRQKT
jgi:hypothetical protein